MDPIVQLERRRGSNNMATFDPDDLRGKVKKSLANNNFQEAQRLLDEINSIDAFVSFCETAFEPAVTVACSGLALDDLKKMNLSTPPGYDNASTHTPLEAENTNTYYSHVCTCTSIHSAQDHRIFDLVQNSGYEKLVFFLLQQSPTLSYNVEGDTVLHIVARERKAALLELLVYCKWFQDMIECCNKQGFLPLHEAARSGFHLFFHLFYPVSREPTSTRSFSAICMEACSEASAAGFKSFDYTERESRCGSDDVSSELYKNSCSSCKLDIDHSLLKHARNISSVSINTKTWCEGSPLTWFVESSFVQSDIARPYNFSFPGPKVKRKTCLSICIDDMLTMSNSAQNLINAFHFCKVLVKAGARGANYNKGMRISDNECRKYFDLSPLHLAAGLGSVENTKSLLNNGANPGLCLGLKLKPAVQLALSNGYNKVGLFLLNPDLYRSPGFLQKHADRNGDTLFHSAVAGHYVCSAKVLERLHQLLCPLDQPNKEDMRPLDVAIFSAHLPTIRHLLNMKPALVNVQMYQDARAYPPLHRASTSGSLALCKLLLSYGADINACSYKKSFATACYRALKFDCPETGVFLCENSSRPFTMVQRQHLQLHISKLESNLSVRLKQRLETIPSLTLTCLDAIRNIFIQKYYSFEHMNLLPLPSSLIKALRYEA